MAISLGIYPIFRQTHMSNHVEPSGIQVADSMFTEAKAAARHAPDGYRAVFDANGVATLKDDWNEPYIWVNYNDLTVLPHWNHG